MKIVIISHTPHYSAEGTITGWGPTIREIDHLATLFDDVVHIAPLHQEEPPPSALPYEASNVRLYPVKPSGGLTFWHKLNILTHIPMYLRAFGTELVDADVVHLRCPANISLIALVAMAFRKYPQKRWFKYAGNWKPTGSESRFYTFQRWWLRNNFSRGEVTVNGDWEDAPGHVQSFFNPSLTQHQLNEGRRQSANKRLSAPLRILFVGGIRTSKGVDRIIHIAGRLKLRGVSFQLDLIGGGPELATFQEKTEKQRLQESVTFHGWLPRDAIDVFYEQAHLMLFPSSTEGWPKVLSEGMAYGVVPIASNVSSIPQYLARFETGRAIPPDDLDEFVEAIQQYVQNPTRWQQESANATQHAYLFSYQHYLEQVQSMLDLS